MGIIKLAELIRTDAPASVSYKEIGDYSGKVIALDTSIVLHQFRSALPNSQLSLLGVFYRTLTFLEHDIKPVFVFDGKPPKQKRAHAPADAEAFCAHLVRSGAVDAVASEDMDTLAFGGSVLLRQLNAKRSSEVIEYNLPKLLQALQLTQKEFVDLCILLGCDYCDKIAGLGPTRALKLIQEHRTIEDVLLHVNRKTHPVPVEWQYQAARQLFLEMPQLDPPHLEWKEPNEEQLVHFLCQEKHLREKKVRGRMEKYRQVLTKRRREREEEEKSGGRQTTLNQFFRVTRRRLSADAEESCNKKRAKSTLPSS